MCAFMPKYHWLPFLVWCMSGSRLPSRFFVELGAAMMVASTSVPSRMSRWCSLKSALILLRLAATRHSTLLCVAMISARFSTPV